MRIQVNRVANNVPKEHENVYAWFYGEVCPVCGIEIYGLWMTTEADYSKDYPYPAVFPMRAKSDVEAFLNMEKCPVCGNVLSNEDGYFVPSRFPTMGRTKKIQYFEDFVANSQLTSRYSYDGKLSDTDLDTVIKQLFRDAGSKRYHANNAKDKELLDNLIDKWKNVPVQHGSQETAEHIKHSTEGLKHYIYQLLNVETNIYAMQQRLQMLFSERSKLIEKIKEIKLDTIKPYFVKLNELKKREPIPKANTLTKLPMPDKPKAPVFKEAGLFNRKKVEAENAQIKAEYEELVKEYKKKKEQRRLSIEAFDSETERLKKEAEQEKMYAVQLAYGQLQEVAHSVFKKDGIHVPLEEMLRNIDDEIAQVESLLQEYYKTRNALYSYDIIFGKYRDPVALATFYEYLMAGRVEGLEGATGAYNLYESEIRANMIISQLSQVISLLEQIKDNQYTIYSEMKSIKSSLNQLSATMETATKSIMAIEQSTARIANFTEVIANNSNVIAYNTAKTAFYAKKNAELTNAMGYLIALK